jgi:hypothetical protein
MKWIVFLVFAALYGIASAQPAQPSPNGPPRPDYRPGYGSPDYPRPLTCWEWRRDAARHPCVRIPPRCRYYRGR